MKGILSVVIYTLSWSLLGLFLLQCSTTDKHNDLRFEALPIKHLTSHHASTGGVSWIDYNQDGWMDLFIANGYDVRKNPPEPQPNYLYRNEGNGQLVLVEDSPLTAASGFSSAAAWGDIDNDGDMDVFIANQRGQNNFFFRMEDGHFVQDTNALIANDGGASFAANWVDVDSDGYLDLYVANGGFTRRQPDFLYRNRGNGQFSKITEGAIVQDSLASTGSVWGDYDNDGDLDLFVPNIQGRNALYRNEGNWDFTAVQDDLITGAPKHGFGASSTATWVDYDNDLDLDLFVKNLYGLANYLYQNDNGSFTEITDQPIVLQAGNAGNHTWADFDNDGDLDLLESNWAANCIFFENRAGQFIPRYEFPFSQRISYGASIATADYDKDGDLDVCIGNWPNLTGEGEKNDFYINQSSPNNWLRIKLIGSQSNRNGIGAKITLTTTQNGKQRQQFRQVLPNSNFRSQDELIQHFGLGKATKASVRVVWPSGKIMVLEEVDTGQVAEIVEE